MSGPTRVSRFGIVNTYLVREDDGLTVIDTMIPGSAKAILAGAERLSAPATRIVLTHAHSDHVGSLDALVSELPDATCLATWHPPTNLESARKLRALAPARLAPGHGKVVEDPGAAMDAAIERAAGS